MYSIRLEGDTRAMLRKIKSFSELDKKKLNAALAAQTRTATLDRFKKGKGPDGKLWEPSARVKEKGGKTLIQTAQLRNSIRVKSDGSGFAVGTNLKHAATHQFGEKGRTIQARRAKNLRFQYKGRWISKKKVKISIPARPFLGFSEDDQQEMKSTVEDYIGKGE